MIYSFISCIYRGTQNMNDSIKIRFIWIQSHLYLYLFPVNKMSPRPSLIPDAESPPPSAIPEPASASVTPTTTAAATASTPTTAAAATPATKTEPGKPPSRAGACRVCLKSFKPDDFSKTCSDCQQRVCEDCASYSKQDESDDQVFFKNYKQNVWIYIYLYFFEYVTFLYTF